MVNREAKLCSIDFHQNILKVKPVLVSKSFALLTLLTSDYRKNETNVFTSRGHPPENSDNSSFFEYTREY